MRTGAHPDMKFNQLFYGGYIGVGSPIDQTWWVDDLIIADGLPLTATEDMLNTEFDITIFPNPSEGTFRVKIENQNSIDDLQFQILDVSGKILFNQKLNSDQQIFHLNLMQGFYLVRIIHNQRWIVIKKIIFQ